MLEGLPLAELLPSLYISINTITYIGCLPRYEQPGDSRKHGGKAGTFVNAAIRPEGGLRKFRGCVATPFGVPALPVCLQVPDYLLSRQEEWERDEERRKAEAPDPSCPPGMKVMPEEERLSTLKLLQVKVASEGCRKQILGI